MTRTMRRFTVLIRGKNKICSKSMGWKAFGPPVLGWHQLGWANRERSNGRDFYSSACSDLLRAGRWRRKALDAGAGENENDNDPAFLTARRREYPPHTPHRYLVAARVAHRSQRGRSAARVRSPYSRCPPQVYHMAAEELFVSTAAICMVSTHVWDNLGAQNVGCPAALIARPGNAPSPALAVPGWPAPAVVGPDLPSVAAQLIKLWR